MSGPCNAVIVSLGAGTEECEANARLIAAAPRLLEVLERLVVDVSNGCRTPDEIIEEAFTVIKSVKE